MVIVVSNSVDMTSKLSVKVNTVYIDRVPILGDTASSLGTAMDELMRHQPTLKTDAMKAIIKVKMH